MIDIHKVVREEPEQLPEDVTRAAADAGLGAYEVTWKPKFALRMTGGLLLAAGAAGLTVVFVREHAVPWWVPVGVSVVVAALALLYIDPRRMRMRVFGFAGGLVFRDRKGALGTIGWDGIARAGRSRKEVLDDETAHVFTVELCDGGVWSVDDRGYPSECLEGISRRVERELTARRLPGALARIADGGQVECGGAVVDATGVTSPTLTVRWSEVRRVNYGFSGVSVLTSGGWRYLYEVGEHPTPEVDLLAALTRRFARG
jgi:hypothetical protein